MDCMNSLGEVISIEDVDDIGGSCWTYIRVSVHGVSLGEGLGVGAVSVGDTFLFSVAKKLIAEQSVYNQNLIIQDKLKNNGKGIGKISDSALLSTSSLSSLISDSVCVTHAVPYYRVFLGVGSEDKSALRFLSCIRNPHM